MTRECVAHKHACYCREAEFAAIKAERDALLAKQAVSTETYKMLLAEAQEMHLACIKDAYELLGIDGSDGEYRYKWVALEIARLTRAISPTPNKESA